MADDESGYIDTPRIPGSAYRVHDPDRPEPPRVDPGEAATERARSRRPSDANVLIDGADLRNWRSVDGEEADWVVEDDYVEVRPGSGDIRTEDRFGDCHLHVEWAAPPDVDGTGQGRGNSGVFLMDRYEIQVLDCYENETYADGYAAAVYGQHPPLVNACREPGAWQTYDILWRGPRFSGEALRRPARVTVLHNGIVAQHQATLIGPTAHRDTAPYSPHPREAPLRLQDHGDRVRFRNVWYRPLSE